MQRKLLLWNLKPFEAPPTDITEVTVDAAVDRASGVEVCSTTFIMRTGAAWAFPCFDKRDAQRRLRPSAGSLAYRRLSDGVLTLAASLGFLAVGAVMILYERARLRADLLFPKSEGPRTLY